MSATTSPLQEALAASPLLQGLNIRVFPGTAPASDATIVREVERVVQSLAAGDYEDVTDVDD